MSDEGKKKRGLQQHNLLFGVRRSVRYHARRRRFFDRLGKFITFFTVVTGVGTVTTLLAESKIATLVCGLLVAVFSTIDLVVGCAESARRHSDLAWDFTQLESQMVKAGDDLTDAEIADFICRRLEIESEEPTILRVLDLLCHNELCRALGYEKCHEKQLSGFQIFCAHFFDVGLSQPKNDNEIQSKAG